ncbi:MAG: pseudaminic acid cytidylyltransferase [Rhodanobacteraceae bacterium]
MMIAVIPARGGSKRIPRKNIKPFRGRPMITWSIEAAQRSACFDRIIVSTEDEEVADVARAAGAEVPFLRPRSLADDLTTTGAVMKHAVEWCTSHGPTPDPVCCIYATAPFVQPADIRAGLDLLVAEGADYAFTVTPYSAPIQRALRVIASGRVAMFQPEFFTARSQDLEPSYHDAAQFYWGRFDAWKNERPIFSPAAVALKLPRSRVQDIDTPEDWTRAELLSRIMQTGVSE